jgi:hypothetical protein
VLFEARRDGSKMFEVVEETLDEVAKSTLELAENREGA